VYFLINGGSIPDLVDPNYASEYPHQPYNGNPHLHPGELTLIRTIAQGRWQHLPVQTVDATSKGSNVLF